ncbi:hypothetical protein ACIBKX_11465 [Streptomyces sp. NPDC050658]|uniref:hypothetical protein n=1 Tax=unclassified Streptomyces TaxID=2593676 RepID=UPI00342AA169
MCTTRVLSRVGALGAAALLALGAASGVAAADSEDPENSEKSAAPTEAGTSFRTATAIQQDQEATAEASTGDYLYWAFPADTGERPTVHATVRVPEAARGRSTWQVDVYDGLRRHQACRYGAQTKQAAPDAETVELSCTLRTVRGWAEPWSNDPLRGTYYVRLTVTDLKAEALGLPMKAAVKVTSNDAGGAQAVDGALAKPMVPGIGAKTAAVSAEPEDGWSSSWWSSRWLWTAGGGVLAALAGVGGYCLTRGSGRPARVPAGI